MVNTIYNLKHSSRSCFGKSPNNWTSIWFRRCEKSVVTSSFYSSRTDSLLSKIFLLFCATFAIVFKTFEIPTAYRIDHSLKHWQEMAPICIDVKMNSQKYAWCFYCTSQDRWARDNCPIAEVIGVECVCDSADPSFQICHFIFVTVRIFNAWRLVHSMILWHVRLSISFSICSVIFRLLSLGIFYPHSVSIDGWWRKRKTFLAISVTSVLKLLSSWLRWKEKLWRTKWKKTTRICTTACSIINRQFSDYKIISNTIKTKYSARWVFDGKIGDERKNKEEICYKNIFCLHQWRKNFVGEYFWCYKFIISAIGLCQALIIFVSKVTTVRLNVVKVLCAIFFRCDVIMCSLCWCEDVHLWMELHGNALFLLSSP